MFRGLPGATGPRQPRYRSGGAGAPKAAEFDAAAQAAAEVAAKTTQEGVDVAQIQKEAGRAATSAQEAVEAAETAPGDAANAQQAAAEVRSVEAAEWVPGDAANAQQAAVEVRSVEEVINSMTVGEATMSVEDASKLLAYYRHEYHDMAGTLEEILWTKYSSTLQAPSTVRLMSECH